MDTSEFKMRSKTMIDYICNYVETISDRRVFPCIKPGYLAPLLPTEAPLKPEKWEDIMRDVECKIMPGVTHWNHPRFFGYFPTGNNFASCLGDLLSTAIGSVGFSWASTPVCTELETIVLDWLGKAINLPSFFLFFTPGSRGGGVLQGSASECVLVSMLAARNESIMYLKGRDENNDCDDCVYLSQLVAYTSKEAHSCVEKAAKICMVKLRLVPTDCEFSMRGSTLAATIQADLEAGLHPFFVSATLGTTGNCGFDALKEIGPIVKNIPYCWFHVDAAYAGCSFICPELRYLAEGLEFADSFNTNCNKFLTVGYDCSCLWLKDRYKLINTLRVEPVYLKHEQSEVAIDYRNWMIPLSRRFRSLKLWFTLRDYGIEGLQKFIRNHLELAKFFECIVRSDDRFEVCNIVRLGLVTFRLKARDEINQDLIYCINKEGILHLTPTLSNDRFSLRFCIVYEHATREDVEYAWNVIQHHATNLLERNKTQIVATATVEEDRRLSYCQEVPVEIYEKIMQQPYLRCEDSVIYIPKSEDCDDISQISALSLENDD